MSPTELWIIYSHKLKIYIMKHVSDSYEAEDILQEVGIRIQKNENRIKDITNIEAWLYRITYNLIVDYYRGTNRYSFIDDIDEISVPKIHEHENFNKEAAECLIKLVEYLPETYRNAIIEGDYYGKKQSVLGEKWGLSTSGSKTRIQRARKKLRNILLNCCEVKSDSLGNIIEFTNKDNIGTKFSCINC